MENMIKISKKKYLSEQASKFLNRKSSRPSEIIVLLLLLFMMLYPNGDTGINTYIPYYLIGVLFLLDVFIKGTISINYYLLAFIFWSIFINLIMAPINEFGLFYSIRTSIGIIFPFLAIVLGNKYGKIIDIQNLSKGMFLLLVIQTIFVFIQKIGINIGLETFWFFGGEKGLQYLQYLSYGNTNYQVIGTVGNPNELGIFVLFLLAFLMFSNGVRPSMILISIILTTYIIFSTQSRTAVILFSIIILIRIVFSKYKSKLIIILKLTLGFIVMSVILLYAANTMTRALSFDQLNPRFFLWKETGDIVYSFDYYTNLLILIMGRGISYVKFYGSVDNTFLNILFSSGIIGLILFIMFIIKLTFQSKNLIIKREKFIFFSYIIIFIISCTVIDIYFNMKVSFLLFFILGYLLQFRENR